MGTFRAVSLPKGAGTNRQPSGQCGSPESAAGQARWASSSRRPARVAAEKAEDDGANGADPTPANNSSTDTTPVDAAPDLTIAKDDGGATAVPGGTIAYTLTYANDGNQDATGVALSDVVPANTTFDAGGSTAGWSCANGSPAGTPRWGVGRFCLPLCRS